MDNAHQHNLVKHFLKRHYIFYEHFMILNLRFFYGEHIRDFTLGLHIVTDMAVVV